MPTAIDRSVLLPLLSDQQEQLVDVLPPAEFEEEHLPGAINIPLKQLDRETTKQLDRARPVVVYCHDYQ
jgi:rhodanese-related sulfurtransferase